MVKEMQDETWMEIKQSRSAFSCIIKIEILKIHTLFLPLKNATDVCEDKAGACSASWKPFYGCVKQIPEESTAERLRVSVMC